MADLLPEIKRENWSKLFDLDKHNNLIAERFGKCDPSVLKTFLNALDEGQEKTTSLRVMLVGHFGAGKTTLTRKLLGKPAHDVQSTNGIDIQVHKCLAKDKGNWKYTKQKDPEIEQMERFATAANSLGGSQTKPKKWYEGIIPIRSQTTIEEQLWKKKSVETEESHELLRLAERIPESLDTSVNTFGELQKKMKKGETSSNYQNKTINIWDFGGQLIFYATHQLFHSPDAIYLLVLDMSKELDDMVEDGDYPETSAKKDVKSFCKFWLNSIHSFAGTLDSKPPVILVGTHMDMVPADKNLKQKIASEYFEKVKSLFSDSAVQRHIQPECFCVDHSPSKHEMTRLREYIVSVGETIGKEIPAKWIPLEGSLMKKISQKHVSFDEFCDIGTEHNMKDKADLIAFLQYLHSQGSLIYFNEPGLSMCVVLNPQWIVDALKCFITCDKFSKWNQQPMWVDLKSKAILHSELIVQVWTNDEKNDFIDHMHILLQYMVKFGIIAKAQSFDEENSTSHELDFYVVPSLLRSRSTYKDVHNFTKGRQATSTSLVFSFENDTVSTTLYHRTTAAALGKWPAIEYNDTFMVFEDMGLYRMNTTHAGIIEVTDQTLEIRVISLCREGVDCDVSDRLRRFLEMVLKHEFGRFQSCEDKYTIGIRCAVESRDRKHITQIVDLKKNASATRVPCPELAADHDIDVQTVMRQWYPVRRTWCDTTRLRSKISDKELYRVAKAIGNNWESLASSLEISKVDCDHIKMDHQYSVSQIFNMLVKWRQQKDADATFGALISEMEKHEEVTIDWDLIKNIVEDFEL